MCNFEDHVIWSLNWQIADIQDTIFNLRKLYSLRFPRIFLWEYEIIFLMCSQTLMMWIKSKVRNDILFFQKAMKDKLQIFRNQLSLEPTYKKNYFWIFFKIGILLVLLGRILELFSSRNNTEFNILSTIGSITIFSHIFNIVNGTIFRWNNILK